MSAWDHHCVYWACHAHLAIFILNTDRVQKLGSVASHHLRWVHHALPTSIDLWQLVLLLHKMAWTSKKPLIRHVAIALGLKLSVWVCWLCEIVLQGVHVVRILVVVNDQLRVLLMDTLVIEEVLNFNQVHAHVNHLLEKGFLALCEKVRAFLITTKASLLRQLLLNASTALFSRRHRNNVLLLEKVEKLSWHLF